VGHWVDFLSRNRNESTLKAAKNKQGKSAVNVRFQDELKVFFESFEYFSVASV